MLCSATRQDVFPVDDFGSEEALAELDRLLADPLLKLSERNRRFLRFAAEEALAGRANRVKSYTIAVDVFGRSANFDPVADPIVRIEATRLRSALRAYYDGPGQQSPIRVTLPKGSYIPQFVTSAGSLSPADKASGILRSKRPLFAGIAALGCGLAVLGFFLPKAGLSSLAPPPPRLQLTDMVALASNGQASETAQTITLSLLSELTRWGGLRVNTGPMEGRSAASANVTPERPFYTLDTSLESSGKRLRLWWQLRDGRTSEVLAADRIDALSLAAFHVEDVIAHRVVTQVAKRLSMQPPVQTAFNNIGSCGTTALATAENGSLR